MVQTLNNSYFFSNCVFKNVFALPYYVFVFTKKGTKEVYSPTTFFFLQFSIFIIIQVAQGLMGTWVIFKVALYFKGVEHQQRYCFRAFQSWKLDNFVQKHSICIYLWFASQHHLSSSCSISVANYKRKTFLHKTFWYFAFWPKNAIWRK